MAAQSPYVCLCGSPDGMRSSRNLCNRGTRDTCRPARRRGSTGSFCSRPRDVASGAFDAACSSPSLPPLYGKKRKKGRYSYQRSTAVTLFPANLFSFSGSPLSNRWNLPSPSGSTLPLARTQALLGTPFILPMILRGLNRK